MQIAPGIHSIGEEKGGHVHAFLLDDGDGLTLIDALFSDDASVVLAEIAAMGRTVADLKRIILTHAHRSHVGGAAKLKELSKAQVFIHEWEVDILRGKRTATRVGLWPKPPKGVYKLQVGLALGLGKHVACEVDQTLKEGDHCGPLTVIGVPGHTPGSLAYWWPERKALFPGDIVVTWPRLELGWEGLTLDTRQNRESVGKLSDITDAEILGVGHGEPIVGNAAASVKKLLAAA